MDLTDPQTWIDEWRVFISAPQVVVPMCILVAGGTWWFKSILVKHQMKAKDERIELAKERMSYALEKQADLEKQIVDLKAAIAAGASKGALEAGSAKVGVAFSELKTANVATSDVLGGFITGQRDTPIILR